MWRHPTTSSPEEGEVEVLDKENEPELIKMVSGKSLTLKRSYMQARADQPLAEITNKPQLPGQRSNKRRAGAPSSSDDQLQLISHSSPIKLSSMQCQTDYQALGSHNSIKGKDLSAEGDMLLAVPNKLRSHEDKPSCLKENLV